jgi:RNA recognition motif-containing protein
MDFRSETPQRDALAEGRRIYLGNLLYSVKPADVEDLMRQSGFDQSFEKLHISVDPVSGRNPGYCFVEFTTREEADRALDSLQGASLFHRPVKVGPCHPKSSSQQREPGSRWGSSRGANGGGDYTPTFQRWGDWKAGESPSGQQQGEQGPQGAMRHLDARSRRNPDKAQLYIGGLGKMISQEQHDSEMQEILSGFE